MWKETAIKIVIGISGITVGALFVVVLRGAAQSGADRLLIAQDRTRAIAAALNAASMDDVSIAAAQAQPGAHEVR